MTAPVPSPSYYFSVSIADMDLVNQAQLSQPVFGPGQPYYPTGADALLDVLFGVTRDLGHRDNFNQIVIHLPYTDAYFERVAYIDGEGMAVTIGQGIHGAASGHRLQAIWKIQPSERSFQRAAQTLTKADTVTIAVDAEPHYFSASLQDAVGVLVDTVEYRRPDGADVGGPPLPVEALPESLDFLASVWRNLTGHHLFEVRRISPSAELTASVASREDFSSRMSALGDVLKAISVDDSMIDPQAAKGLADDTSLARLKLALLKQLSAPEVDVATTAVGVLQDIVRVRVSLQHPHARPDLPTAFARLGISYPAAWSDLWRAIRERAVGALRDLRNALESASP